MFTFRAKTKAGNWVEGFYVNISIHEIIYPLPCGNGYDAKEIIPETLGVSYGRKDLKGNKIFASFRKDDNPNNPYTTGGSMVEHSFFDCSKNECPVLFHDGAFWVNGVFPLPLHSWDKGELTVIGYQTGEKL